jgi:GAF domain-containing protein
LGDGCAIRLLSEDGVWLQLAALYNMDAEQLELTRIAVSEAPLHVDEPSLTARAFQSSQPLFVPVVDQDQVRAAAKPEHGSLVDRLGIHSLIVVPMRVQGRPIGVLSLSRRRREQPPFSADDLTLAQDLADRAALAISNARLLQALQRELAERTKAEAEVRALSADLEQRVVVRTAELTVAN